ncbi:hypothetical protein SAMN05216559_3427 [Halomicrobium zhouii]|uniref:Uncharacterized protein n=1 Tax=Halomicrobium zhouii TaxID=767519 RepID=A0A1I6LYF0_9EURY|nr:hypothetical protein [Halomicrobium zhouii]SFS08435.1 hypothetical protein SAMN05216559_3427 [Halomicrobium zhouii]
MVGPSITDEEREQFLFRLRVGFSLFVGASMALVVVAGDGSLPMLAGAFLAGTAAGAALAWWVFPDSMATGPRGRR